ncbi:MAG: hypothetical protein K1X53_06025 [Candidatus Sumerlaeaceae bacterium]|nr:hypothetical protein [Candidatus Sumerlaeaceae bacterium]
MTISALFPPPSFPQDNPLTEEGVALGKKLFFDKGLSSDGTVSCATCHRGNDAFADSLHAITPGVAGEVGRRNAMPLFNLAWRRGFFWDGRTTVIREQVFHPITDPKEMNQPVDGLMNRIAKDPGYKKAFAAAFGTKPITSATLGLALEQFLLVQISQDSKFDRARRGETTFTQQEERGLELFFTEYDPGRGIRGADCFHCHGNTLFTTERFANNGLDAGDGKDLGRFEVTGREYEKWCFKIPSLRNVELTPPYMHDGRFRTLEEVIEHYDHGVKESRTLDPNLAKHQGAINLSPEDKQALIAFLKTLTDEAFVKRAKEQESQAQKP